jgi:hypothetical protein
VLGDFEGLGHEERVYRCDPARLVPEPRRG